jgi:N-acetylneuraminate lyase
MLPLYKKIYSLYLEGKMQEALCVQKKADKYISILLKYSLIPAVKAVLEEMGHNVGPASEPMKLYTSEEKKIIINDLKSAGFEF